MKLSVVVPVYNEKSSLREIIRKIKESPVKEKEIVIIDDFSTDGTRELLKEELEATVDKVIYHDRNRGKGAALRSGLKEVSGDCVVIQDADLEYDPSEYPVLMKPILENKADVVYGSRFQGGGAHRVLFFWHSLGNRFLTLLSNMFTDLNLTDMETCYKMFRREVIQSIDIEEDRFGFEPEVTAKLAAKRCIIYEVGISYHGRTYEEGKKIGWQDGCRAIYVILKYGLKRHAQIR
ncbi:MAG: glycosyltransferase family 2 protein [Candidatus Riflebacteria bacterium]|nr:glycosyltransferase family 2 protein [Candidatus Riflebacteria bacterium]